MRTAITSAMLLSLMAGTAAARTRVVTVAPADRKKVAAVGIWSLSKRVTLVRLSRMQKTIRPGKGIRFSTSYRLRVGRRQYRIPKLLGLYLNGQALTARSPERFYGNEALVDKYRAQPHFGPGEAPRRMARGEDYAAWR